MKPWAVSRQLHPPSGSARAASAVSLPAQTHYDARQRSKRLHKILDDGGIKVGGVVSDINGLPAREMAAGLIDGKPINELLDMERGRLKLKCEDQQAALGGDLTARHKFVLKHIHAHIEILDRDLAEFDANLLSAMTLYLCAHRRYKPACHGPDCERPDPDRNLRR
jgi:hypothetical protein